MSIKVQIKLLSEKAKLPDRASEGAAGLDLFACADAPVTLVPMQRALIPTGVAIALPSSEYAGFVFARSGLSTKHGIALANGVGVIDSDYRGEIKVGLVNLSNESYTIQPGDRIAQLVFIPIASARPVLCDELPDSGRGDRGFGSTGR